LNQKEVMKGSKNNLHAVFVKRILAFLGISAFSFFILLTCSRFLISALRIQHLRTDNENRWQWSCALFLTFMVNFFLDLSAMSDTTANYFSFAKPCKRFITALITGIPIGYCLQRFFLSDLSLATTPIICMSSSVVSLLLLTVDLEERVQFSPLPATPISQIPSSRRDFTDSVTALLATAISAALFLPYFMDTFFFSKHLVAGAVFISLIVVILKIFVDSLFVNLFMYPIDFEKLKPSSLGLGLTEHESPIIATLAPHSSRSQIFNSNYFYAVQNFRLVFLLNNLGEGLGFEEINCSEFLTSTSFDTPSPPSAPSSLPLPLPAPQIVERQAAYVNDLFLATSARLRHATSSSPLLNTFLYYGIPRPPVISISTQHADNSHSGGHSDVDRAVLLSSRPRPSLLQAICTSLALGDLTRLARLAPARRALLFRSPLLLDRALYALCSLLDSHAVQVIVMIVIVMIVSLVIVLLVIGM
jgi:hypothetical protein